MFTTKFNLTTYIKPILFFFVILLLIIEIILLIIASNISLGGFYFFIVFLSTLVGLLLFFKFGKKSYQIAKNTLRLPDNFLEQENKKNEYKKQFCIYFFRFLSISLFLFPGIFSDIIGLFLIIPWIQNTIIHEFNDFINLIKLKKLNIFL